MNSKIKLLNILCVIMLGLFLMVQTSCNQKKLVKSESGKTSSELIDDKVYQEVDEMPEFPGGTDALRSFLGNAVRYPVDAMKKNIQGKVFVTFVVGKDGAVKDVKLARGADPLLDDEAMRVVRSFPKWKPGKEKGKIVNVSFTVPINFKLQ